MQHFYSFAKTSEASSSSRPAAMAMRLPSNAGDAAEMCRSPPICKSHVASAPFSLRTARRTSYDIGAGDDSGTDTASSVSTEPQPQLHSWAQDVGRATNHVYGKGPSTAPSVEDQSAARDVRTGDRVRVHTRHGRIGTVVQTFRQNGLWCFAVLLDGTATSADATVCVTRPYLFPEQHAPAPATMTAVSHPQSGTSGGEPQPQPQSPPSVAESATTDDVDPNGSAPPKRARVDDGDRKNSKVARPSRSYDTSAQDDGVSFAAWTAFVARELADRGIPDDDVVRRVLLAADMDADADLRAAVARAPPHFQKTATRLLRAIKRHYPTRGYLTWHARAEHMIHTRLAR